MIRCKTSLGIKLTAFFLLAAMLVLFLGSGSFLIFRYDQRTNEVECLENTEGLYRLCAALCPVSFLLGLLLFVYLMWSAGHKKDLLGINLDWFDRIYFDLFTAAFAALIVFLVYLYAELSSSLIFGNWFYQYTWHEQIIDGQRDWWQETIYIGSMNTAFWQAVLLALPIAIAFLYWVYSFAKRIKSGTVLRHTLIYKIFSLFGRGLRTFCGAVLYIFRNIGLLWKLIAALFILGLLHLVLVAGYQAGGLLLLYMLVDLPLLVVLCHMAVQINRLRKGAEIIAGGDPEHKIQTKWMFWDFKKQAEALNSIGDGIAQAVNRQMRSERMKAELITNVSHDIKTPLTSIINYVDLLKKAEPGDPHVPDYLDVLDRKSQRLKKLTEDLVEASKASTGTLPVTLQRLEFQELLGQTMGEYEERFAEKDLKIILVMPENPLFILGDSRHMWRILDNVFSNIYKYALSGTRVYINAKPEGGKVRIEVKNIAYAPLNIGEDELMERFVRGDEARGDEGSGLGLSIAWSLAQLQGGSFDIAIDGDLFKVIMLFDTILKQ